MMKTDTPNLNVYFGSYHTFPKGKRKLSTFNFPARSMAEAVAFIERGPCAVWIIALTEVPARKF